MIVVKITDGLGNQMFQYAFGRSLSLKLKTNLLLDIENYRSHFRKFQLNNFNFEIKHVDQQISNRIARTKKSKIYSTYYQIRNYFSPATYPNVFSEEFTKFDRRALSVNNDSYIIGYFQSEKYFAEHEDIIRKDFSFNVSPGHPCYKLFVTVRNSQSVGIHFRRSDYIHGSYAGHYALDISYYKKALDYIKGRLSNPSFYIFSDDMDWVRNNFAISDAAYIEYKENTPVDDLWLMSNCRHFIIANSSFSWWGAWLSDNDDKIVVAPEVWYNKPLIDCSNIVPSGWIKI